MTDTDVTTAIAVESTRKAVVASGPGTGRGGYRPGSGRKKGGFAKRSQENIELAKSLGLNPVEFLLSVMNDPDKPLKDRIECAKAVAPYVAPRLAAVESRVTLMKSHEEVLDELDD